MNEVSAVTEFERHKRIRIRVDIGRQGLLVFSALQLTVFGASVSAGPTLTYDGSEGLGKAVLEKASSIVWPGVAPLWMGLNTPDDQGLVYRNNGTVITGADLVVDYSEPTVTAPLFVIGGYSGNGGDVQDNTVTIKQGVVNGPVYGGLSQRTQISNDVDKSNNQQAVNNAVDTSVLVASSKVGVNNNKVSVNGDAVSVAGNLYGGNATVWGQAGDAIGGLVLAGGNPGYANVGANVSANDSTVTANGNAVNTGENVVVKGNVYGGFAVLNAQAGDAIGGPATAHYNAYAQAYAYAYADKSTVIAKGNAVNLGENAVIRGDVYGGFAELTVRAGEAMAGKAVSAYRIIVDASTQASASAYDSTVSADSNTATMGISSTVSASVYGGWAELITQAGNATANMANGIALADASAQAYAYAFNSPVSANGNSVSIGAGSVVGGSVYGSLAKLTVQAADATSGTASASYLPETNAAAYAPAKVSYSSVSAGGNAVTIEADSTVGESVYGGLAEFTVKAGNATAGNATGTMTNSTALGAADAVVDVSNSKVFANNNVVAFNGSLQSGDIYGGYAKFDITPGSANSSPGNSVDLTGSQAQAINNIVTIGDNARISSTGGSLYGGYLQYNAGFAPTVYDAFTGNTLNFSAQPVVVNRVANFEHYYFTLEPKLANTSTALITANDIVFGVNNENMNSGSRLDQASRISVAGIHSGRVLSAGDAFVLMNATNSMVGNGMGLRSTPSVALQGISLLYDIQTYVDMNGKTVTAKILACQASTGETCQTDGGDQSNGGDQTDGGNQSNGGDQTDGGDQSNGGDQTDGGNQTNGDGPISGGGPAARVNPQLKALSEGYLAGSQLVMRGADLIADEAFGVIREQNRQSGWVPFILSSAANTRYNSGSHINANDFLLSGGVSYRLNRLVAGTFIEGGWGSYDSYNSFNNAANVYSDGRNRYYGMGLLGRYDFDNGFYADASVRFGKNRTSFDTDDIQNLALGKFASYNLKNRYVSAHIGVGYVLSLADKNQLDISAKYLHTTVSGKNVAVTGDPIHFDRVNSNRVRVNATLNHKHSATVSFNTGLGYEHEFDSRVRATTYGIFDIEAPSVKGGTGILSLGATVRPAHNQNLSLGFKATGYMGKREGAGASIQVNYAF